MCSGCFTSHNVCVVCGDKTDHGHRSSTFRADVGHGINACMCDLGVHMFRSSLKSFVVVILFVKCV